MLETSFRTKAQLFAAQLLLSASMIFLHLGFTYLTVLGEKHGYLMLLVAPIAISAFTLGTTWGIAQAVFCGTVLYVHSIVQPLDEVEYFLMQPATDIVPLVFAAIAYGILFDLLIKRDANGLRRVVYLALVCAWGTLTFSLFFDLAISFKVAGMDVQSAFGVLESSDWLANPLANLVEIVVVFVSVALTDLLIRRTLAAGENIGMRVVFGARLYFLLALTFFVLVAIGFSVITTRDVLRAHEEMDSVLDVFSTQFGTDGKTAEKNAAEAQPAEGDAQGDSTQSSPGDDSTVTAEDSSTGEADVGTAEYTIDDIVESFYYEENEDNALVLVDDDGVVATSSVSIFYKGQDLLELYGPTFMNTVKSLASSSELQTTYIPKSGGVRLDGEVPADRPDRLWTLGYMCARRIGDRYLVYIMTSTLVHDGRLTAVCLAVMLAGVSGFLSLLFASKLLRSIVVRPLDSTNESLAKITAGDLGEVVRVNTSSEFVALSSYINETVESLKEYAAESERRIEQDLETAKVIQENALPRKFPAFPEVDAFDIYASMCAAKYVGGDFYDFFLVDEHKLGFLIADVSGKGIPAALFMMRAKTSIATCMQSDADLARAVRDTNLHLCEGNNTLMFVTLWAATFDWETGELVYVNGGHDVPLLRHDGCWDWLKTKGGPFLGAADLATYTSATITLHHGDALLLYTDGVTEAMDPDFNEYGKDRLLDFVQRNAGLHPHALDEAIRHDLHEWAGGAEQSDDITMLTLEYR